MPRYRNVLTAIMSTFALSLFLCADPAAAEGEFSVLGLSASPDAYVDELEVEFGENFELYVIIAGPGAVEPLAKEFVSVRWAVLQACCGGSPALLDDSILQTDSLSHIGEPVLGVHTTAPLCVESDIIHIATLTFTWIYVPEGTFVLGAAAMSAAEFCGEDTEFLSGCSVRITPLNFTPNEDSSWGEVKALYR